MSCIWLKTECPLCKEALNFSANLVSGAKLSAEEEDLLRTIAIAGHKKFAHPEATTQSARPAKDEECKHGMEFGCTICSGKDKPEPEKAQYGYWAKYDGQCPGCNLPIAKGQRCVKTTRDRNLHEGCL